LGELAEIKDSARIPNAEWSDFGVPYIRASDITNKDASGVLFISNERYEFYKNKTGAPIKGDVLFNGGGEIGKTMLNSSDSPIYVQGGAVLYARTSISDNLEGQYLKTYFETPNAQHYFETASAGGTMKHFTLKPSQEMPIKLPQMKEQKKIGSFFSELDTLITLHQSKCYGRLRHAFLNTTISWEQRKVGEVIEDYVEKTTVQNQYPVLTSSQQQGIVLQEDYFADRQVTTNDNVGYYVLPRGYFTYRSRSDTDLFVFNRNNLIDKGIISYYYPVFRPKNADSNFLLRRLNKGIRSQVSMAAEGTGQHVLAHSKLKNMEFLVPSVPEQKLIGAYFEILDHLITLHQRELKKLQMIKKSMLRSMFV